MDQVKVQLHADELRVPMRLIVAPATGMFRPLTPDAGAAGGLALTTGDPIGVVERPADEVAVVSCHDGLLMGLLVLPGERVRECQPVAWLRVAE
jgi:hypothetical protein